MKGFGKMTFSMALVSIIIKKVCVLNKVSGRKVNTGQSRKRKKKKRIDKENIEQNNLINLLIMKF